MSKRKIIKGDYTVAFHSGSAKNYQPIVGNYNVSEETSRQSTGISWEGSQGEPMGDYPQHDAFESAFGGRFLMFMSNSSDWGFCNDKIVQAQNGDTFTSLISNPDPSVPIQRGPRNIQGHNSQGNPVIGLQNIFTEDGKLYTSIETVRYGGSVGIGEYTRVFGGEGENDRWELTDYIPIGTGSFSTMDPQFDYTIVTGSTPAQYFADPKRERLYSVFKSTDLVFDVCKYGEEKYLAVNLMAGIYVDRNDEAKGVAYSTKLNNVRQQGDKASIEPPNGGQSNWFFLIYRSGSTTGWRQETAITPKLFYDFCFAEDNTGARTNLRLNDQDFRYRDNDSISDVNKNLAERHWIGHHRMIEYYLRQNCDSSGNTFNPDNNISKLSTFGQDIDLEGFWVHENIRKFQGTCYGDDSIQQNAPEQVNHRALPWMDGWIVAGGRQGLRHGRGPLKFCISDHDPQLRLASLSAEGETNLLLHKSSSVDGWEVEDFVYAGDGIVTYSILNTTQNFCYSPSRNEFYLNSQNSGAKTGFIQIISSASSGIYFEPDNVTWKYLNNPLPAESAHVIVDVLGRQTSPQNLKDHHTGSFTITDHEGNDMTITIIANGNFQAPTVSGQTIIHRGNAGSSHATADQMGTLKDYIVEAVNNGGQNGTADYFFTASLIRDGVQAQYKNCVIIQSTISSSAANVSIDDSPANLQPLSTDIRFSTALQNDYNDASTFFPVGQATMVSGSRGAKLSGRGGFRPARIESYTEVDSQNQSANGLWFTGAYYNRQINSYFTIDENGEVSDYNEDVYKYGVPSYLVDFGESEIVGADRIDLWQLQRTGVLGETTDGPEGSEWLTMWENSNSFYVHDPDPAMQANRYGKYWSNTEAFWVNNFGRILRIDSYGRLYTVGAGQKAINGTGNVSAGNPEGHRLSLRDRVYILNSASVDNHKTGSSGWYVEHVIYDPDYEPGGPLHGLNDFTYASRSADGDDTKFFFSGFGAQIEVNKFAEDYTTQLFISSPLRLSDALLDVRKADIDMDYHWHEPAGAGFLYQSSSENGWAFEQKFENPVTKFLSRPEEDITYSMSRYRGAYPQLGWRHFGGFHNTAHVNSTGQILKGEDVGFRPTDYVNWGWYTSEAKPMIRHAFSGSVLALSWWDKDRSHVAWPFERGYDPTGNSSSTSAAFGNIYPLYTTSLEEYINAQTSSFPASTILIYDGNAEYITTTTYTTTRTVNIVDGPVPTRVGNVAGVFNIKGQTADKSYRVSVGDKKK